MKPGKVNLVTAADERYFPGVVGCLVSAARNLSSGCSLDAAVIVPQTAWRAVSKLQAALSARESDRLEVSFLRLDDGLLEGLEDAAAHISPTAFARLFIPELMHYADRVIYVDPDTVVEGDLAELWHKLEADSFELGAVIEQKMGMVVPERAMEELRIDAESPYFNSGVLAINLSRARETGCFRKALGLSQRFRDWWKTSDQDLLNMFFENRFTPLEGKWNQRTRLSEDGLSMVPKDAGILHSTGPFKPWMFQEKGCHGLVRLFYRYVGGQPSLSRLDAAEPHLRQRASMLARFKYKVIQALLRHGSITPNRQQGSGQ